MKTNWNNYESELEYILEEALQNVGVKLSEAKIDKNHDDFNYTRIAEAGDLRIEHKKLFDGRCMYEQLELGNKEYDDGKIGYIVMFINNSKIEGIFSDGEEESDIFKDQLKKDFIEQYHRAPENHVDAVMLTKLAVKNFAKYKKEIEK